VQDAKAFSAGDAGTVWLQVQEGRLVVTKVETTWTYLQRSENGEIEIVFRSGDRVIEFEAELQDGNIKVEVDSEDRDGDEVHRRDNGDEGDRHDNRDSKHHGGHEYHGDN